MPDFIMQRADIHPVPATVFDDVGEEVILLVVDPTPAAAELATFEPFALEIGLGSVATPEGALGYAIFVVPNPAGGPPLAAWERYFDAGDAAHLAPFERLAEQTHWHVVALGAGPTVIAAYEVANDGSLDAPLKRAQTAAAAAPLADFVAGAAWAQGRYPLAELFNAAVAGS
jgi:hypothetical protein